MEIKPAMVAIAAFVVITVIAAVLMPVLQDATATEDTLTNKGLFYIENAEEELHYVYADKVLTLNGDTISIPSDVTDGTTIIYTENLIVRAYANDMRFRGLYDYNATSFDITISNGTITGNVHTTTDHSISTTYTNFYGITNEDTGVVMTKVESKPYVKTDTPLSSAPLIHPTEIGNSNTYMIVYMTGSIDDGLTFSLLDIHYGTVLTGYTVSDYEITKTPVNGYEDLYQIEEIKFTVSTVPGEGQDPVSTDRTFTYVALDEKQTAERTVHLSANESAILLVIPALVIIAIIIGILAYAIRMRE